MTSAHGASTSHRGVRLLRLWSLLRHDARLQRRYGIWYAYAFVIGFYVIVLRLGGDALPPWLKVLVLYTDPSVFGFFFLGALLLLEKSENSRIALAMTPVSAAEYFWSKAITLTLVALIAVLVLLPFLGTPPSLAHVALLLTTVILTSLHYVGLGVPAARHFKTVTSYLMGATGWLLPLMGPGALGFLPRVPLVTLLIPAVSQVVLLRVALGAYQAPRTQLVLMLLVSVVAAWGGVRLGVRSLEREFGTK